MDIFPNITRLENGNSRVVAERDSVVVRCRVRGNHTNHERHSNGKRTAFGFFDVG